MKGLARKSTKTKIILIETVHVNDVVTDWSYALAEFLVSSLFLFLAILATFTLQMFFSFDNFIEFTCLDFKTLTFQWATIKAREWLYLPLFRTRHYLFFCQRSCRSLLEVRKLLKLLDVAYLEGRLKSRSYGN